MAIKMLALDLDDTLLDERGEITARCRDAVRRAAARGVRVVIATGRMYRSARRVTAGLELDMPIISYNGAVVKASRTEEILLQKHIDPAAAAEVLDFFRERGWYVQVYEGDEFYVKEMDRYARSYEELSGVRATVVGDALYTMTRNVPKLLAMLKPERIPAVAERFQGRVYAAKSRSTRFAAYLEMVAPDVNKAAALEFLRRRHGIGRGEIMAVGDSDNDLDMIKYAGLGVAMGNAFDGVKAAAAAVTLRNDEDGVAAAIEKYILTPR